MMVATIGGIELVRSTTTTTTTTKIPPSEFRLTSRTGGSLPVTAISVRWPSSSHGSKYLANNIEHTAATGVSQQSI